MKRSKFEKLIEQAPDLPTLPDIAANVLQAVRDPASCARDLEEIIELDPILSTKVMRMVNSAYFGLPDPVSELRRAIALLGFHNVRNLAFTVCMKSLYQNDYRCGTFTAGSLWLHSVSVAVVARMVAQRIWPELAEEAFLSGIVHDVGMIAEWNMLPDRFDLVVRHAEGTGCPFIEAEKHALGFDHCACGSAMLRKWGLPKHLSLVARHHHRAPTDRAGLTTDDATPADRLAATVFVAECVCAERSNGFFDQPRDDELTEQLLAAIGCDWSDYRSIVDTVDAELERARDILSL